MSEKIVADFSAIRGKVRRQLYCSGLHPQIAYRHIADFFEDFKKMHFYVVRNHDWALIEAGQRMIDVHFVFPLLHLDASDERNYVFGPSDEAIRLCYEAGTQVFYRLGTSIEHTEGIHFNANPPADFEKFAEVCAGIIRHYTRGWNNGFHYDMPYWEIWNEPEGKINMWTGDMAQFSRMFALTLKRLKSEFPELKIGGPALCSFNKEWVNALKAECDKLGVKPDFVSFHMYSNNLRDIEYNATEPKKYLEQIGWGDAEVCINEYHFIRSWQGVHSNITEESYRRSMESKDGLLGMNSAAFNIAAYCVWQNGSVDSAYWYGCDFVNWGVRKPSTLWNKNYYSMLMIRDFVWNYTDLAQIEGGTSSQRAQAAISADGKSAAVLVTDFCGGDMTIPLQIKGFEKPSKVTCMVLDDIRENVTFDVEPQANGEYVLYKNEPGSAAFMLLLEK